MAGSTFTLDQIIQLHINLHKLLLTRGSSFANMDRKSEAVINTKNNAEECFEWTVIGALHHKKIAKDPQCISKLRHYEDQFNWQGLKLPLVI